MACLGAYWTGRESETVSGLIVSGLTVSGLTVSGLTVSGLTVSGLTVSGLTVSGLTVTVAGESRRQGCCLLHLHFQAH